MNSENAYVLFEGFLFQIVGKNTSEVTIIFDGNRVHIPTQKAKFCSLAEFLKTDI